MRYTIHAKQCSVDQNQTGKFMIFLSANSFILVF